jgi:fido (protein-threonine AMPylation protein)
MQVFERDVLAKYPAVANFDDSQFCRAAAEIQGEFLTVHPFRKGNSGRPVWAASRSVINLIVRACPWLRDDASCRQRILDVTERNSVIEGLPPFRQETRERILAELEAMSEPAAMPDE